MIINPPPQSDKFLGIWFKQVQIAINALENVSPDTLRTDLAASDGSSLVGYTPPGTGAIARTVQLRLKDSVSAKDFGAVGDNSTNDTIALQNSLDAAKISGKPWFIPPGIYSTDELNYGTPGFSQQVDIIGGGRNRTELRKRDKDGKSILTIGSAESKNFIANISVSGLTFKGHAGNTPAGIIAYDLVRSVITDCILDTSVVGLHILGTSINNVVRGITAESNQIGIRMQFAESVKGAGDPNSNTIQDCILVNNKKWGLYFDDGRLLNILGCGFEGNGQNPLGADFGGLFIGESAGTRRTEKVDQTVLNMAGCWFEGNSGIADIWMQSGFNTIRSTYILTSASSTTNDIRIDGGRYSLRDVYSQISKTANVLEGPDVSSRNLISNSDFDNISIDPTKTTVQ